MSSACLPAGHVGWADQQHIYLCCGLTSLRVSRLIRQAPGHPPQRPWLLPQSWNSEVAQVVLLQSWGKSGSPINVWEPMTAPGEAELLRTKLQAGTVTSIF